MPQSTAANPFIERDELLKLIRTEFAARDPHYNEQRNKYGAALEAPAKEIAERQRNAEPAACAYQVLLEAQWLVNYGSEWPRVEQLIGKLKTVLADAAHDTINPPQADDGSWAGCIVEPYRKLEPTVDALQELADDAHAKPLAFIADLKLGDAKAVLDRLWRLQTSDIRGTGRNNRDELGATQTALSQLIFKDNLRSLLRDRPALGFDISPMLEADYGDYLRQTQHPRTGYWGPWYRMSGQLLQVQDLSFTYHTINYRGGHVDNWPTIIETTLDIEPLKYPMGWTPKAGGQYSHHNNYDVVSIFMYGWPHMDGGQKARVRQKIDEMLAWCLTRQVTPEGGLLPEPDTAMADSYYYAVRFLDRLGYWDELRRFWSRKAPPLPPGFASAGELARKLSANFETLGDHSDESATVRSTLKTAICLSG